MERLTYRDKDGFPMMKKRGGFKQGGVELLAAYEDTGLTPEDCARATEIDDILLDEYYPSGRMRELIKADKAGRLVVLPCKVGDVVYGFHNGQTILPMVVKWIETNADGWTVAAQYTPMAPKFYKFSDFGKTVFLTHEKAEEALWRGDNPKQVFEEAYRPTDGLSFGLAIEAAKKGMKIARRGWNGKNQYVELAERISYENAAHEVINAKHEAIGNKALAFVGTSGVQLGWLASQADMLADDWMIVGDEVAERKLKMA